MPKYLGVTEVGWYSMLDHWWDRLIAGLLLSSFVLGSLFAAVILVRKIYRYWQSRRVLTKVPKDIVRYLAGLGQDAQVLRQSTTSSKAPKTFGVYLGAFSYPPTPNQLQILSQWEALVVDPFQEAVYEGLTSYCTSNHVLGRMDLAMIAKYDENAGSDRAIRLLGMLSQTIFTFFTRTPDSQTPFTGILLANWQAFIPPVVLNELLKYLNKIGLNVYLELAPPDYLNEEECRTINLTLTKGIVCRNATILPNGDRCNYYQMTNMRRAQRAWAANPCPSGSSLFMWEAIDDGAKISHAVTKRSYNWCRFNNALSWIGSQAALINADIAVMQTVIGEPLGAMMWLKEEKVMSIQEAWRLNDSILPQSLDNDTLFDSLHAIIPDLVSKFTMVGEDDVDTASTHHSCPSEGSVYCDCEKKESRLLEWTPQQIYGQRNPLSFSHRGEDYIGLGCFQLGLSCIPKDFDDIADQQRRLRDLGMLQPVASTELTKLRKDLQIFYESLDNRSRATQSGRGIQELLGMLARDEDDDVDRVKVYIGLHSGFRTTLDCQLWGVYSLGGDETVDIYVAAKTKDIGGVVLHTFLSSKGCSRADCFMAETAFARKTGRISARWDLPNRIVQDIESLSPTESIMLSRRLALATSDEFSNLMSNIRTACEYQLLEVPSLAQLRALNSTTYLQGKISPENLIASRIAWYDEQGCQHPSTSAAIAIFHEVDNRFREILMNRESHLLLELQAVLESLICNKKFDARTDLFTLAVFCACRKLALYEIYLEILDRNPLPNTHPDQAACYAEMFATGSQCEQYFDMTPNMLGKILDDRYRLYYKNHQPPIRDDKDTEIPTAYASNLVDLDPNAAPEKLPLYYQVTFLGIFALPALIDIVLLTTVGRGLYLTAFMTQEEKSMATTALMLSLFFTGAIGTWIGSGGSYYLHSMAFPTMNMFVLTRFVAGVAICAGCGALAFFVILIAKGIYAAFIFSAYFLILSTYFSLLATLAIYQLPGFIFQSGRMVIMFCIPILFISPILTLWIDHDIIVYLCTLAVFLSTLLLGARRVISQWTTWFRGIRCLEDREVLEWYNKNKPQKAITIESKGDILEMETSSAPRLARLALLAAVTKERKRRFWVKPTEDELVRKLAEQHLAVNFLMSWYCKYTRTKMPYPFSPTWNLQCNAGLDTLREMQKGLKLHNAFVHWRHAGDEVWCGVLYFIIALMDKWVALISNVSIVGLSDANSETYRLAVGFGLASYLISAVFLDAVAHPLWATANKKEPRPVRSLQYLRQVAIDDATSRRKLYWGTLLKYFFMHLYGIACSTAIMWTFEESRDAVIMFLSYVAAYTGLLWYQYNRVFAGSLALKDLVFAAILGLIVGPILHRIAPTFAYSSVIALAVSTWTAAMLSIWTSNVGWPRSKRTRNVVRMPNAAYHCSGNANPKCDYTQLKLAELYQSLSSLPVETRHMLYTTEHPGVEVLHFLAVHVLRPKTQLLEEAFPMRDEFIAEIISQWQQGQIVIELIQPGTTLGIDPGVRAIGRSIDDRLHIFVFVGLAVAGHSKNLNVRQNCKLIAEALIHIAAEKFLGLNHDLSSLAMLLAAVDDEAESLSLPEGIKSHLNFSIAERTKVIDNYNNSTLHYLLLGLNCDVDWDNLPKRVRSVLLKRCCGEPCVMSNEQFEWFCRKFGNGRPLDTYQYIVRCDLGVDFTTRVTAHAERLSADYADQFGIDPIDDKAEGILATPLPMAASIFATDEKVTSLRGAFNRAHFLMGIGLKFLVVTLVADPEFQRELDFLMKDRSRLVRWPITFILNCIWQFCKALQKVILPWFIFHNRDDVYQIHNVMQGVKTTVEGSRILVEAVKGPTTFFTDGQKAGAVTLREYNGNHTTRPTGEDQLVAVNKYMDKMTLCEREEYAKGKLVNAYVYEYPQEKTKLRFPIQRRCVNGALNGQVINYDHRGFVTSGSYMKDGNLIKFDWYYRRDAKFEDELIRAEYRLAHLTIKIAWCVPPPKTPEKLDLWLPNSKVMEATFIEGTNVYRSQWNYDHKSHPVVWTDLNGLPAETPPMIQHDWFKVLQKPKKTSFMNDNHLFSLKSIRAGILKRMLRLNTHREPVSTSIARTHLWKAWKNSKDFDAVTARWMDEMALRSDKILRPYWVARDMGRLRIAQAHLEEQADTIMTRCDIDSDISSWTLIAYKYSDLMAFGQGGDATINTRNQKTQMRDNDDTLHVLAMDTGTWPNEGGGVSACRRDMVNNLSTIRWHVVAENANDFGLPKFQVEKNVQSLTVLPLWGLDFLTPTHGVFQNYLDSAVQQRSHETTDKDIRENFFPILTALVRCARAVKMTQEHLDIALQALVDLNAYFQTAHHWSDVWLSDLVKEKWRELWLTEDMENTRPISEWLEAEYPTLLHMDQALDMWHRYLFIFSIPVPEKIPDVFQASHHFSGASYGVLCKKLRNCTLHVWDHCISWREVTVFLSSAMSFDPPFVCSSLIGLSRVTTILILTHADVVLPCADFFNPGWEVELGTLEGTLGHRKRFARKIDPVVNGIANMERFQPIPEIKSKKPTVSMLSHIRFVKDIKNAVLAADIIVNDWGMEDYTLEIYGDMIRAPAYSVECQEIIAAKGLGKHVLLKGLGSPAKVLEDAWIFLNCSVSEGLPLAMGEAALTGVPVVCTDVGASFRVVTDIETGEKFSAVVAPNDSYSLARAQVEVLAMLGEWAAFAEDDPSQPKPILPFQPTREEAQAIVRRMYEKTEQRRKLGMRGRDNVLNSFSSDRYLREHEQMLWIGKYRSKSYNSRISVGKSWTSNLLMFKKTSRPMSKNSSQVFFLDN